LQSREFGLGFSAGDIVSAPEMDIAGLAVRLDFLPQSLQFEGLGGEPKARAPVVVRAVGWE
jgi:hypothetical protein